MDEATKDLEPIEHYVDGKTFTVELEIYPTMHDGKNRNAIYEMLLGEFLERGKVLKKHGQSHTIDFCTCWICFQLPSLYNSLDTKLFIPDDEWVDAVMRYGGYFLSFHHQSYSYCTIIIRSTNKNNNNILL